MSVSTLIDVATFFGGLAIAAYGLSVSALCFQKLTCPKVYILERPTYQEDCYQETETPEIIGNGKEDTKEQ